VRFNSYLDYSSRYAPPFLPHSKSPRHNHHLDPSNFDDADLFIPKRWMPSHRDQVLEKRAFIPFSTGPYNCVGQIFAIMEMKTVIARLVQTFYIEFAPGEKGKKLFTESKDHLTMDAGPLVLCFNRRG
jgi:cytochrome P450 family 628